MVWIAVRIGMLSSLLRFDDGEREVLTAQALAHKGVALGLRHLLEHLRRVDLFERALAFLEGLGIETVARLQTT